jgi:hypothetical protein
MQQIRIYSTWVWAPLFCEIEGHLLGFECLGVVLDRERVWRLGAATRARLWDSLTTSAKGLYIVGTRGDEG